MRQNGFIKLILLIIIILAVLSYFGIKISSVIENDVFQENFNFVWNWCKNIWNNYLIVPASYLWSVAKGILCDIMHSVSPE